MAFWKPTKNKIITSLLFIALGFSYSLISGGMGRLYKSEVNKILDTDAYSEAIKEPAKKYAAEALKLTPSVTPDKIKLITNLGYINISTQVFIGLFISYFGACIAHRKTQEPQV